MVRVPSQTEILNVSSALGLNSEVPSLWTDLVAAYPLQDGGETANPVDVSGNNYHGTGTGIAAANWASDDDGTHLLLNGTDEKVAIPTGILTGKTTWTISMWLWCTTANARVSPIGDTLASFNAFPSVRLGDNVPRKYQFYAGNGSAFYVSGPLSSGNVVVGAWEHLVFQYDGANLLVYRGGSLTDTLAATDTQTQSVGTGVSFGGASSDGSTRFWPGKLRNIAIWDAVLTAPQIAAIYADQWAMFRLRPQVGNLSGGMLELSGGLA